MVSPEDRMNAGIDRMKEEERRAKAAAEKAAAVQQTRERMKNIMPSAKWLAKLRKQETLSVQDPFFKGMPKARKAAHLDFVAEMKIQHEAKASVEPQRKQEWHAEQKVLSDAFEYVVAKRINDFGWFGNMRAQLTTEYDDYKNGIDIYVERDGKPIGLSFDLTFTSDRSDLAAKLAPIKSMLAGGKVSQLEYYVPLDPAKRAEMKASDGYPVPLPKLIIGVTRDEMLTTIERFVEAGKNGKPDAPTGLIMLYQSLHQLRHFVGYIERIRAEHPRASNVLPIYKRSLAEMESIWKEKLSGPPPLDEAKTVAFAKKDKFTKNLTDILDQMFP